MTGNDIKKFLVFFTLYFITVMVIQVYLFPSEDKVITLVVKNLISGLIASVIFTFLTRKKIPKK